MLNGMTNKDHIICNHTRREYEVVDVLKILLAFAVIAIHTEPFAQYGLLDKALGVITRIPVPFFFVSAGFFLLLAGKSRVEGIFLWKYVSRIAILYAIWSVIYLPFFWRDCVRQGLFGVTLLKRILDALLWTGVSSHLWFLPANILAAILTWYGFKKVSPKITLSIATVLLIYGTLADTYRGLLGQILPSSISGIFWLVDLIGARNGLFYGFFYFALGGMLALNWEEMGKSTPRCFIGVGIGLVLLTIEGAVGTFFLNTTSTVLWLSTPIVVLYLFIAAINMRLPISAHFSKTIRNTSTAIYTSQFLFIHLLQWLCLSELGMGLFLSSVVLTTAFALAIVCLSRRYKLLRYLY